MDVAASVAACAGDGRTAGCGYPALVVGAGTVFVSALSDSTLADAPRARPQRRIRRSAVE